MQLMRTGDEAGARTALEASFKLDDFDVVTKNLLDLLDKLDTFVTVRDGDIILRMAKDEAPVLQDYALTLAHQALTTLAARYEFTPRGPILIEIFPKHDDFAVRTAGLPGMIGALGACFGRVVTIDSPHALPGAAVPVGSDALARARARHHDSDVEPAHPALAHRRHLGLRRAARASGVGAASRTCSSPSVLEHGQDVKLRDLNAAFTDPQKISLAYYQASLLVEHIVTAYGDAGLRALVRVVRPWPRHRRRAEDRAQDRLRSAADRLRSVARSRGSARCAARSPGPTKQTLSAKPLPELRDVRRRTPAELSGADGARSRLLLKSGDLDEAGAGVPAWRRRSCPWRRRRTQRWRRSRDRQARSAGRDRRDHRRSCPSISTTSRRRVRWPRCCTTKARMRLPAFAAANTRIVAIDPFDSGRAPGRRPHRDGPQRAGRRLARVPRRPGAQAGGRGRRAHRSRGELLQERASARKRRSRRSPRSRSRRPTHARRTCC